MVSLGAAQLLDSCPRKLLWLATTASSTGELISGELLSHCPHKALSSSLDYPCLSPSDNTEAQESSTDDEVRLLNLDLGSSVFLPSSLSVLQMFSGQASRS